MGLVVDLDLAHDPRRCLLNRPNFAVNVAATILQHGSCKGGGVGLAKDHH